MSTSTKSWLAQTLSLRGDLLYCLLVVFGAAATVSGVLGSIEPRATGMRSYPMALVEIFFGLALLVSHVWLLLVSVGDVRELNSGELLLSSRRKRVILRPGEVTLIRKARLPPIDIWELYPLVIEAGTHKMLLKRSFSNIESLLGVIYDKNPGLLVRELI